MSVQQCAAAGILRLPLGDSSQFDLGFDLNHPVERDTEELRRIVVIAPSTTRVDPAMKDATGLATKATTWAISSGVPARQSFLNKRLDPK